MKQSRTHHCNELRAVNAGETVTLVGWYENLRRVSKNLGFLILRDYYGTTQVVIENEEMMNEITEYNCESTLQITGVVRERSNKTTTMATGEIEVVPTSVTLLGLCQYAELPFEINHSKEASENTRLKYRFLDLRNPLVKEKIILRSMVVASLRRRMTEQGFLEITTPILTCSSPEGARDYLVPSRNHPGKFYALPQAPQQFKQLLMASGFDRYFQIAPCFRDEDARADRTPGEFYQLDMEMAFASQEDIFSVIEEVLPPVFEEFGAFHEKINTPFRRISYLDAIAKYGSDKPDLRIDLELTDVSELLGGCGFPPFESNGESNPSIQAIVVRDFAPTRKQIDKLCADVEVETGQKAYWFRVDEAGVFVGGISKFLQEKASFIQESLSLQPGDFIGLTSGTRDVARKTAGVLRKYLGNAAPNHMNKEKYEFCWIVDFPMYEMGEESGVLEFCHNPFSMPQGGMNALQNQDPLSILAYQYDLVCNGYETASGAVRNHEPKMMIEAFKLAGLNEDVVKSKFPALYNAFCYGAPPHAGIAPGVDRMIMLLAGEESIREVIPFPMNKTAMDVMMGAPSEVEKRQLKDVHIKLDLPVEEVQV